MAGIFPEQILVYQSVNQMKTETEDDFYESEDELDEDEATQYIIEQSLIQYRKLKGLNPRLVSDSLLDIAFCTL